MNKQAIIEAKIAEAIERVLFNGDTQLCQGTVGEMNNPNDFKGDTLRFDAGSSFPSYMSRMMKRQIPLKRKDLEEEAKAAMEA